MLLITKCPLNESVFFLLLLFANFFLTFLIKYQKHENFLNFHSHCVHINNGINNIENPKFFT